MKRKNQSDHWTGPQKQGKTHGKDKFHCELKEKDTYLVVLSSVQALKLYIQTEC